jgi:AdoMet-dependent heme synthase
MRVFPCDYSHSVRCEPAQRFRRCPITISSMQYTSARQTPCEVPSGSPSPEKTHSGSVTETGEASFKSRDFDVRPLLVIWEMTQACDLKCMHCRASAQPHRHPRELSAAEAFSLVDQVADMRVPMFVLTGGDPLKRSDLHAIIQYGRRRSVKTSLTPSATPLLTREAVFELKESGLMRLALSLDGSTAQLHDGFRGVAGSWRRTLDAIEWSHEAKLPVQVGTTVTRHNIHDLDNLVELLSSVKVVLWSVFFLVPTGRGQTSDLLSPEEHEAVFAKLYAASKRVRFHIKTTEGQHYRRYVLQQRAQAAPSSALIADLIARAPSGVNDGKGFVFISHTGEVYPSGFLPISAGNIRRDPLADIYRTCPLFLSLRDVSQLKGKCGRCEFQDVCGGSRARAFALTGDPLAEEPCCSYIPVTQGDLD